MSDDWPRNTPMSATAHFLPHPDRLPRRKDNARWDALILAAMTPKTKESHDNAEEVQQRQPV